MPVRSVKNTKKENHKITDPSENIEINTETVTNFDSLELSKPIIRAIDEMGYKSPTQIQEQAIPIIIQKHDLVGIAQTGTGKTASFTLPILELLSKSKGRARMPRALILEPTRELAIQVSDNLKLFGKYLKLSHALIVGGESIVEQKEVLNKSVDIVIATPGRLIDLIEKGALLLNQIQMLVIDEADRMLDMGFVPDVEKIISFIPKKKQTLLLSATMSPEIKKLTDSFLNSPKEITVAPPSSLATTIETGLIIVPEKRKRATLRALLRKENVKNAIIFCNRKKDVDILTRSLNKHGFISAALHGDLTQQHRSETMENFKNGQLQFLVCSDIAARGIDIDRLSHVFNFDLPRQAEDYVHRIGRTGRAGNNGYAYSLATPEEEDLVQAIESLTQAKIPVIDMTPTTEKLNKTTKSPSQKVTSSTARKIKSRGRSNPNKDDTHIPLVPLSPLMDNDSVIGFGQFVPAFMLSPFRKS